VLADALEELLRGGPVHRLEECENDLSQALLEADHAKRTELYKQAQKIVLDDAPWIFVNSTLQIRGIRKNVKGFELNPTQMFFGMEKVSLQ